MDSLESNTITFVITIWVDIDSEAGKNDEPSWRGEITEVAKEKEGRSAFHTLDGIATFIRPRLEEVTSFKKFRQ